MELSIEQRIILVSHSDLSIFLFVHQTIYDREQQSDKEYNPKFHAL